MTKSRCQGICSDLVRKEEEEQFVSYGQFGQQQNGLENVAVNCPFIVWWQMKLTASGVKF